MQMININELKAHERNNYFFDNIEGDNWIEFKKSIETSGVIEPIVITQDKIIVSGHQRVRACKELGITDTLCKIQIYDNDEQIIKDLLETNLRQRGLGNTNGVKFARCIQELEKIYGIKVGNPQLQDYLAIKNQSQLANEVGVSRQQLQDYKKLLTLIPELQDLIEDKQLSPTIGYKVLAKLSKEDQDKLIEELGKDKLSEMTQKQLQQYINEKNELEKQLHIERNKPIQITQIDNTDYNTINKLKEDLKRTIEDLDFAKRSEKLLKEQVNLYKEESKEYRDLQEQMRNLTKQKDDISRQINAATSISGLVVEIENLLKNKLAPIQYSRAILDMSHDEVVIENLSDIILVVRKWCNDMESYLPYNKNIINLEVIG